MLSEIESLVFSNYWMRQSQRPRSICRSTYKRAHTTAWKEWLIIQNFFHGLNQQAKDHIDASAGGSFLSLDVAGEKTLIDKIASNQSWRGDNQPARPRGMHQIDSVDLLAAKMDLLMMKLESPHKEVNYVLESRMTCETCGETRHSGTSYPLTQEDANFVGTVGYFNDANKSASARIPL